MNTNLTAPEIRERIKQHREEIARLELRLLVLEPPTDAATLCRFLREFPRVEQRHYDADYGTRALRFYGNCPHTGAFLFYVEAEPGRTRALSFGLGSVATFHRGGFAVKYRTGTVEYEYLPSLPNQQGIWT